MRVERWEYVPFTKAAKVLSDEGKRVKQREYLHEGRIPVIDQGQDFIGGYIDDDHMTFDGDLPVIIFGDHTRNIKYVNLRFAVGAEGVKILKPEKFYEPKFFYYLLKSLEIPSRGYSRHFQFLKKFDVPVTLPTEQKRIVAEIEKQFSRLDEAVAALKRIKANLNRYKASVLKVAVEGKLTGQWRKTHPDTEPASELLKRILSERRREWERTSPTKQYKKPIQPDLTNMPKPPEGWVYASVDQAIKIIDYRGRTPPFSEYGIPHLRSSNIRNGKIHWANLAYVTEETYSKYMTRGFPEAGDLLFTTEAPLGEVAIAPVEKKFSIAQRMMILRPCSQLSPKFLMYQIMSSQFQALITGRGTGTTVTGVSSRNFRPASLCVPPISEQEVICDEVESRLAIADSIDADLEINLKRTGRLRQSILKKAFSGKLVPQ